MWVILGHEFYNRLNVNTDKNVFEAFRNDIFGIFLGNGQYSVDVFFFIGGFFLAYSLF